MDTSEEPTNFPILFNKFPLQTKDERAKRRKNGLTSSASNLEDPSQRLRYQHTTETFGKNWSGTHLHSNPTTTQYDETDDDDDDDDDEC